MGRSFESVRQGVKGPIDHWARTARTLGKDDREYGERLVALAKLHSSEAFYGCDDPLEAVVFSGLIGILIHEKRQKEQHVKRDPKEPGVREDRDVDP